MSFDLSFTAQNKADALSIMAQSEDQLPNSVQHFVAKALDALKDDHGVSVSISGSLSDGKGSRYSTLRINVMPMEFRKPKKA